MAKALYDYAKVENREHLIAGLVKLVPKYFGEADAEKVRAVFRLVPREDIERLARADQALAHAYYTVVSTLRTS